MKPGVPWNVKGVPPQVRDSARKAARASGVSVAEWLNNAILDRAAEDGIAIPELEDEDDFEPARPQTAPQAQRPDPSVADALARSIDRIDRRLDQLLAQNQTPRAPQPAPAAQPPLYAPPPYAPPAYAMPVAYAPPGYRAPAADPWAASLDQVVAEIASRQRALESGLTAPAPAPQPRPMQPPMPPRPDFAAQPESRPAAPEPRFPQQDISGLEQQLQRITTQIENLHRPNGLEEAVRGLREDLTEIGRALQEALPRRAVEALESDMRRLADRIDQGRQCGLDPTTIAGMERGLAEVRDALRSLTPAESLAGFEEAVRDLARKIDQMGASGLDVRTLQQLETAISGLRGVASHIASNDSLTKLADEIRGLSAKVDRVAVNAAGAGADVMSGLEDRIGALTEQLRTMSGRPSLPPRIEEILTRFADRAEQGPALSNGDQLALRNLEDRIADLSAKLDASDARLGSLSAIERGLAELLVHLDEMRSGADRRAAPDPAILDIKRDLSRTHDSLESVHGALSAVVDRLASMEADRRSEPKAPPPFSAPEPRVGAPQSPLDLRAQAAPAPAMPHVSAAPSLTPAIEQPPRPAPVVAEAAPRPRPAEAPVPSPKAVPPASRERRPIDPNLPPDHPIEPGAGLPRPPVTAAERIAASEAVLSPARANAGNASSTNFIAAARRAAMAAGTPIAGAPAPDASGEKAPKAGKPLAERVRALLVAASVVVIVVGAFQLALNYFDSEHSAPEAPASSTTRPEAAPSPDNAPAPAGDRRSGLSPAAPAGSPAPGDTEEDADATGSIASQTQAARPAAPEQPVEPFDQKVSLSDKLPGALRNAAANGDPAAAYEVAMRHLEGRGVPQNLQEAARWLDRAASAGLAPAQFRLGSLYEKGQGVKKNIDQAQKLYLAAAEKGNAKAMHNLAVLYAEGAYGKPDYKLASQWFRKAADRGVADSQYNLGVLYARGIGVEQNLAESFKWFSLAAAQGDKDSAKKRDEVAAKLDPQSLVTARLAVQTFAPQPQPEDATTVRGPEGGWERPAASPAPGRTPKKPRTVDPMRLSPT